MAYELIETIEVGAGGAASIEFTSIPQDGVDLVLVLSTRMDRATDWYSLYARFNDDSTTAYSRKALSGDGSSVSSLGNDVTGKAYLGNIPANNATANSFNNVSFYISNYTSSNTKAYSIDAVSEANATEAYQNVIAGSYPNSTGVTKVAILGDPTIAQYSTASLYKIY